MRVGTSAEASSSGARREPGRPHTVRHLIGRATGATVIVLSGGSLGAVEAFGNLARRLAPSVVVLEDVPTWWPRSGPTGPTAPGARCSSSS